MHVMRIFTKRPELFFRYLSIAVFFGGILVWNRVDFVNAYDVHFSISYGIAGIAIALLFFVVSMAYKKAAQRGESQTIKGVRWHIFLSSLGPLGTLPVLMLSRKITLPVNDLIQYAADMQFNDRLMLLSIGLWLIALIWQVLFLIRFLRFLRHTNLP